MTERADLEQSGASLRTMYFVKSCSRRKKGAYVEQVIDNTKEDRENQEIQKLRSPGDSVC
jgi:hypothetical protein